MIAAPAMSHHVYAEAVAVAALRLHDRQQRATAALTDDAGWRDWLKAVFPGYVNRGFAPFHATFWDWVWSISPGERSRPFIGIWPRGFGKSTSVELAIAAIAARKTRRYVLYVCHQYGTPILDPDSGLWMPVEDHPSALPPRIEPGFAVRVWGLPFRERVTSEHRYWAMTIGRRDRGHGRPPIHEYAEPGWIEARRLTNRTWIGHPIDFSVDGGTNPLPFDAPEWWWFVGLWWGDGTLGGPGGHQMSIAIGNGDVDIRSRLIRLLDTAGIRWGERPGVDSACTHISFYHPTLATWLYAWRRGGNAQKCPPESVERLPLGLQQLLIQGYVDADGQCDRLHVGIASVSLDGLQAARRILARLGIAATIHRVHRAGPCEIAGRIVQRQDSYRLRMQAGASSLGYPVDTQNDRAYHNVFIRDGWLWSRVREIDPTEPLAFVPITTSTGDYLTAFGRSHNCESQEQADDHVANVAGMLEGDRYGERYPQAAARMVGKYGNSRGWRRNRLRTASGLTVDAIGLDTAARGVKLDESRPDLLIFDDIDGKLDTPATTHKKIVTLTHTLIPAGSDAPAVLAVQNIVIPDGIFARLADGRAEFLADRIVSGPHPAITNLTYEQRDGRTILTGGEPTWPAIDLTVCQSQVDEMGITAFLAEKQHDVDAEGGGLFDHLDFRHCTADEAPDLVRVAVWVDPAVTNTDESDAHGIQADGLAPDGDIYRLFSWEDRTSPRDALRRGIVIAVRYGATEVGVETDQGGDTWKDTYQAAARELVEDGTITKEQAPKFRQAKAGAGHGPKVHRASQMLADYERGRIIHVTGTHQTLERALRRFPKLKPFDLVDASYWSWQDLRERQTVRINRPIGIPRLGGRP